MQLSSNGENMFHLRWKMLEKCSFDKEGITIPLVTQNENSPFDRLKMGTAISRILENFFGKQECRILMVGLDAAGKVSDVWNSITYN
jgi:hypothetical protein